MSELPENYVTTITLVVRSQAGKQDRARKSIVGSSQRRAQRVENRKVRKLRDEQPKEIAISPRLRLREERVWPTGISQVGPANEHWNQGQGCCLRMLDCRGIAATLELLLRVERNRDIGISLLFKLDFLPMFSTGQNY